MLRHFQLQQLPLGLESSSITYQPRIIFHKELSMANLTVTVGGTPSSPTFTGDCDDNGNISVQPGMNTITFNQASLVSWDYASPGFTISPPSSSFDVTGQSDTQVVVTDNDTVKTDTSFEYTLYTNQGPIDPRILNKSSP